MNSLRASASPPDRSDGHTVVSQVAAEETEERFWGLHPAPRYLSTKHYNSGNNTSVY